MKDFPPVICLYFTFYRVILAITAKFYVTFLSCAFFWSHESFNLSFFKPREAKSRLLFFRFYAFNVCHEMQVYHVNCSNMGIKAHWIHIWAISETRKNYWYLGRLHFNFDPHVIFFSCRVLVMYPLDITCKSPSKKVSCVSAICLNSTEFQL